MTATLDKPPGGRPQDDGFEGAVTAVDDESRGRRPGRRRAEPTRRPHLRAVAAFVLVPVPGSVPLWVTGQVVHTYWWPTVPAIPPAACYLLTLMMILVAALWGLATELARRYID